MKVAARCLLGLLLIMAMAVASGCGPTSTPAAPAKATPTPTRAAAKDLTEGMLKEGKYQLRDLGAVQLKDGNYEHKYGEGATQVNRVGFDRAAFGDLNGDGAKDAAAILWANTGGSGTFIHLVALINRDGTPEQAAAEPLGDRVKVNSLSIEGGKIVVGMLTHGPKDPMCCPSQPVTNTYRLEGNALKGQ